MRPRFFKKFGNISTPYLWRSRGIIILLHLTIKKIKKQKQKKKIFFTKISKNTYKNGENRKSTRFLTKIEFLLSYTFGHLHHFIIPTRDDVIIILHRTFSCGGAILCPLQNQEIGEYAGGANLRARGYKFPPCLRVEGSRNTIGGA